MCEEVWNDVLVAFYMLNSEIIFSKPGFETEQLLVREQLVFEVKDSGKKRFIHVDKKFVAHKIKFEFFNSILDCQNLLVDHMVVLFSL